MLKVFKNGDTGHWRVEFENYKDVEDCKAEFNSFDKVGEFIINKEGLK